MNLKLYVKIIFSFFIYFNVDCAQENNQLPLNNLLQILKKTTSSRMIFTNTFASAIVDDSVCDELVQSIERHKQNYQKNLDKIYDELKKFFEKVHVNLNDKINYKSILGHLIELDRQKVDNVFLKKAALLFLFHGANPEMVDTFRESYNYEGDPILPSGYDYENSFTEFKEKKWVMDSLLEFEEIKKLSAELNTNLSALSPELINICYLYLLNI